MAWIVALAVFSLLTVLGMVQFITALIAATPSSQARWTWAGVYAVGLVGVVYSMLAGTDESGESIPAAVVLLVPSAWVAINAGFVRLWYEMGASIRARGGTNDLPPDADQLAGRASRLALLGLALTAVALWGLGAPQQFVAFVTQPGHRLAAAVIALAVAGWAALIAGGVRVALGAGHEMTHEEIEEMERTTKFGADVHSPVLQRRSAYRIYGPTKGLEGSATFTFDEIRDAWRSGLWRRDPRWQTVFMMMFGAIAMVVGGAAAVFLLGSSTTRMVFAGVLIYAAIQATLGIRAGRKKRGSDGSTGQ